MAQKRTVRVASNRETQSKGTRGAAQTKRVIYDGQVVKQSPPRTPLYRLVYRSTATVFVTGWLCLCFLLQPLNQAYAQTTPEPDETATPTTTTPAPETHTPNEPTPVPTAPSTSDPAPEPTNSELPSTDPVDEPETEPTDVPSTPTATATTSSTARPDATESSVDAATATTSADATTTLVTSATTSASSTPAAATPEADVATTTVATSTNLELSTRSTTTTTTPPAATNPGADGDTDSSAQHTDTNSTTSTETAGATTTRTQNLDTPTASATAIESTASEASQPLVSVVESDTHVAFSREECTVIEDGSYYCQPTADTNEVRDRLLARPDADGDLEIVLVQEGAEQQITNNQVDDAAPYYDPVSETIVWHRLINDRFQIITYDTNTGDEVVLTHTRVNDMEPARHGERIVWQRWVEDNWEIMLWDNGELTQITDSAAHDLAPHIRGPLVIWNSRFSDGTQALQTYDIAQQTITTIGDESGVSVSNPRMVVMYEAMYENGDIVTKGFDIISGEIVPLQSLPRELPDELPDSDSTGETRALIQNKPNIKQSDDSGDDSGTNDTDDPSTADPATLDLRPTAATTTESTATSEADVSGTSTIPDLVLTPATATTASSQQTTE